MSAPYTICGAKKSADGSYYTYCDASDPDADKFEIRYFVRSLGFTSSQDFDSLYDAQQAIGMLNIAWEEGKREAFAELRALIGVK